MIDFIVITAPIESLNIKDSIYPFEWKNLFFTPKYKNEIVIGFESNYNGLKILLTHYKIRISNSLHKFLKGNNYSNFSFTEIKQAVFKICKKFDIEESKWIINKLEFGLNLNLENTIIENLNIFHSYKSIFFQRMMHKNIEYGRKCFMSEYALKIYDKSFQIKMMDKISIPKNLTRIEFCYNQKRKLPKSVRTLADLIDKEKFKLLYNDLKLAFSKIIYKDEVNFSNSTYEDRLLLNASLNSDFLKVEQKINKSEIKAIKHKIKQVREKYYKPNFKNNLIKQLKNKYIELYCD